MKNIWNYCRRMMQTLGHEVVKEVFIRVLIGIAMEIFILAALPACNHTTPTSTEMTAAVASVKA